MPPQVHTITSQHEEDEQQPQSQNEQNGNTSPTAVTEELRRQVSEMQIEMQRQAARHEKERLQWKEERQSLTTLLRQQRTLDKTAVSPRAVPRNSQPKQSLSLLIDKNEVGIEELKRTEQEITQLYVDSHEQLRNCDTDEERLQICSDFKKTVAVHVDYVYQLCQKILHTQIHTEKIRYTEENSRNDPDEKLTSNCATETTIQNPEIADHIRNDAVPATSLSCSDMQTTGSGLPQASKMLPSQAKKDSSVHISNQPEISKSSLDTTGKVDRNIVTRFIRLSPLLPKENSAFNDIPISREDKLLKRIMERRPFRQNGGRTDGNRKRHVTPTLLSKSRVFKEAAIAPEENFSRDPMTSAMGQQRIVDQLPQCLAQKTSEERVSKQLNPSVSGLVKDFEPLRDSKNRADGIQGQIAENRSCEGMSIFSQSLSPEGETDSFQDGCNPIGKQSRFDRLNQWYEELVELVKLKESQLSPSRGQAEPIWRVAANYYSTYKSSPESGCKISVDNDAIEEPILPTSRQAENPTIESKIQEHNRRTAEEVKFPKLDYENAKEHRDLTMNCQPIMQSSENVQRSAREFEKAQHYLDAKLQF